MPSIHQTIQEKKCKRRAAENVKQSTETFDQKISYRFAGRTAATNGIPTVAEEMTKMEGRSLSLQVEGIQEIENKNKAEREGKRLEVQKKRRWRGGRRKGEVETEAKTNMGL